MKRTIPFIAVTVMLIAACNSHRPESGENKTIHNDTLISHVADTSASANNMKSQFLVKEIVDNYLQLKNTLAEDNSIAAAAAGKALAASFRNFNKAGLSETQQKTFTEIAESALEDAEHIGKNGGNIAHQREHFEMLSQDIYDLVKAFGNGQVVLYDFFCPMYNNGKGASWLSETKDIKNPYMGKAMATCGTLKEELK
jgi:hypothetical protein